MQLRWNWCLHCIAATSLPSWPPHQQVGFQPWPWFNHPQTGPSWLRGQKRVPSSEFWRFRAQHTDPVSQRPSDPGNSTFLVDLFLLTLILVPQKMDATNGTVTCCYWSSVQHRNSRRRADRNERLKRRQANRAILTCARQWFSDATGPKLDPNNRHNRAVMKPFMTLWSENNKNRYTSCESSAFCFFDVVWRPKTVPSPKENWWRSVWFSKILAVEYGQNYAFKDTKPYPKVGTGAMFGLSWLGLQWCSVVGWWLAPKSWSPLRPAKKDLEQHQWTVESMSVLEGQSYGNLLWQCENHPISMG